MGPRIRPIPAGPSLCRRTTASRGSSWILLCHLGSHFCCLRSHCCIHSQRLPQGQTLLLLLRQRYQQQQQQQQQHQQCRRNGRPFACHHHHHHPGKRKRRQPSHSFHLPLHPLHPPTLLVSFCSGPIPLHTPVSGPGRSGQLWMADCQPVLGHSCARAGRHGNPRHASCMDVCSLFCPRILLLLLPLLPL